VSITDPQADDAQPQEGQGSEASGGSPWESLLSRFPDDVRDQAAEAFREQEANANKRFEEHASFRKQWEPLANTGVDQLSAEEVAWLVQFRGALEDPQTMQQWWDGYAQQNGLNQPQEPEAQPLDDFGFQDPAQLQQLIDQATGPLKQQLEQMQARAEEQDRQQAESQAHQYIDGQLKELESKHGKEFNREMAELFASKYIDSDPLNAVPRGWADFEQARNAIEKQALQPKVDAPAPAEGGGVPDTSPDKMPGFGSPELKDVAMQFLRNNR